MFTLSDEEGKHIDYAILRQHPEWTYDILEWGDKDIWSRFVRFRSGLVKRLSEKLFFLTHRPVFASLIVNRHYHWQVKKARQAKADLHIAHNLGALPVAKAAIKKHKAEYGFDAEDFHRQEVSDDPASKDFLVKKAVEEDNLPGVHHFTAASPLIGEAYQRYFPSLKPTIVLNVFPKVQLSKRTSDLSSRTVIKLFWFSQTIGGNRGLETVVRAMGFTNKKNVEKAQTPFQGVSYLDKDDIPIAELEEETKNEDDENYSLNKESVGLEKRIDEEKKENEELYMYIEDSLDQGFIDQFLTNDPESFTVLEKKIKQNYYSNPVYKFLLNINIDSFLT
ncbi:MAG: hypothetical protein EOO10_03265, partial [Chitinophagaceae bacterium]